MNFSDILEASSAGFALGASLIIAIGAQNAFVLRQGLRREQVGTVVLTCTLIDAALISAGCLGLGRLVGDHPGALKAMAWLGAAVLVLYGLQALRRALRPQALEASSTSQRSAWAAFSQAAALSLLNPHVYLDTVLLIGSVGAQQAPAARLFFALGAVIASALWFGLLGYGARLAAPVFSRPMALRLLDLGVALTMTVLAVLLATGRLAG